ncbi:hypothetical protein [Planctomicrobium piriforme]|uniref:Uncharacterized protein n=1 Tax=Planctomicrobium piriforme TaxID=1576369 RepID=A0A1I3Q994_9PLAN|nr:hypothetical protein [Planctomicrobium piriforme]SFJ30189.1 hypothetical protein SAMN05421753_1186 [Planctomicrobium piriforme]
MARLHGIVALLLLTTAQVAQADWPFWSDDGLRRGSKEYYEAHASDPPGARQVYKDGKLWPPFPRPTGPHQLFVHKYHHTHYWPYPYVCDDRESVRTFVDAQVSNGWLSSTTLYDFHFDPATGDLNSAGKEHLYWIVHHVPMEYRQVHVAIGQDPKVTTERSRSVEIELARLGGSDPSMPVLTRYADPVGRPASEVQAIFRSAQENMPPPILSQGSGSDAESE